MSAPVCRTADSGMHPADAQGTKKRIFGRIPVGGLRPCRQGRPLQIASGFPGLPATGPYEQETGIGEIGFARVRHRVKGGAISIRMYCEESARVLDSSCDIHVIPVLYYEKGPDSIFKKLHH